MEAAYTVTPRPRAALASTARYHSHRRQPACDGSSPNHDCLVIAS